MLFPTNPNVCKRAAFKANAVSYYPLLTNPAVRTANMKSNAPVEGVVTRKSLHNLISTWLRENKDGTAASLRDTLGVVDYVAAIGLAKVELIEDDGDSDYDTTTEHPRNTEKSNHRSSLRRNRDRHQLYNS